ncbi:MAG: cytochrome c biogenesis protein ResB, partial [Cyclobacteriaceae bacterium]|nr:cytochrome c biogenesis protein ResB [Cyclobacteriaceae bacterium]
MKILNKIFNMSTTGILLVVFGVVIGRATFVENDFGTPSAKAVIYNSWWFEGLLGVMMINMIVIIFSHKLYRKEKLVSFLFHVAFITIILGAAVTRYIGYEGVIHIREGESSNVFVSDNVYVTVMIEEGDQSIEDDQKVLFSPLSGGKYNKSFDVKGNTFDLALTEYIPHAKYELVADPEGGAVLTLVTSGQGGRVDKYLRQGHPEMVGDMLFSLNGTEGEGDISIVKNDTGFVFKAPVPLRYMKMADQSMGTLEENQWHPFEQRHLYVAGGTSFVYKDYNPHARLKLMPTDDKNSTLADAVTFKVTKGETSKDITVIGGKGISQTEVTTEIEGARVTIGYGAVLLQLPFHLELVDFQLERYPGSESPSSYASEVILKDEAQGIHKPFRIYMNHILEHRGFRFYQSSFDQDEKGTILSVNHDYWGTFITYWGYFFLFAGLIAIFFSKNTRFSKLSQMVDRVHRKRAELTIVVLLFLTFSQVYAHEGDDLPAPSVAHSSAFSSILYQSNEGRIMPLNTITGDILRKVVKKNEYKGLNADQVFLGMITHPTVWREEKMIRVNHKDLDQLLGVEEKYTSFINFFTPEGQYKLKEQVEKAFAKKPSERDLLDNELIKVDERVNICYMTYYGSFLKIFPIPGHPDNKWISPIEDLPGIDPQDSMFIKAVIPQYFDALEQGMEKGDYQLANELVSGIKKFQSKFGATVVPSKTKVSLEILYNKVNLFKRLYPYFMLVGFVFLIILFTKVLHPKKEMALMTNIIKWLVIGGFVVHAAGLIARWYISGHEPWSNGYEAMIYIAWVGILAGILFHKKSPITLAVTSILAGIILWVANMSWMDPEITNLVPVL